MSRHERSADRSLPAILALADGRQVYVVPLRDGGRHHFRDYFPGKDIDRDFDRGDWTSLPDGGVFIYADYHGRAAGVFRRIVTDTHDGYQMFWNHGCFVNAAPYLVPTR